MADLPLARVRDPEGARRLHGPRLDLLLDALVRADPVADALVAERGQGALAALEAELPARPPWLTDDALARGGELVHRAGALAMIALASSSLVQGYASPGGNKTLVFTGRLEQQAFRRMHETARFVMNLHGRWESGEDARHITWARTLFNKLQPHASGGAYVNFMTADESSRLPSAYGPDTFTRLAGIKAVWDPDNLFRANHNIEPRAISDGLGARAPGEGPHIVDR